MSRRGAGPLVVVGAVAALTVAIALQVIRDRRYTMDDTSAEQLLYVRSPAAVGRIVLGFDALAADVYWIRAIQHYGSGRLAPEGIRRRSELLYPLLDLTTSLDPYFNIAYRFGAIFLSEAYPGGAGRPDLAIALLQKGIAAQPDRWHYYHDIGFVHYWAMQDRRGAAEWFRKAAERPGAPNWLLPIAAAMLTETTDRTAARYLWRQILDADDEWLRQRAIRGLMQIDALDQIDRLNGLVATGALKSLPADPAGVPYEIDPATRRVTVSKRSPLFPLPNAQELVR